MAATTPVFATFTITGLSFKKRAVIVTVTDDDKVDLSVNNLCPDCCENCASTTDPGTGTEPGTGTDPGTTT